MTTGRKVRVDTWTKAEDAVLLKIIYRFLREGRTQTQAFEQAAHRTGRTSAACAFRWNKELRNQEGVYNDFVRARDAGRLVNRKVKSVRTDKWAEDWKDTDKYSNSALRDAYADALIEPTVKVDLTKPLVNESVKIGYLETPLVRAKMSEVDDSIGRLAVVSDFQRELTEIAMSVIELLVKKNHDYGDSIYETYKMHGDLSMSIRIGDKARRLDVLTSGKEAKVNESIEDIYMDSAGYNLMGLYAKKRLAEEEE